MSPATARRPFVAARTLKAEHRIVRPDGEVRIRASLGTVKKRCVGASLRNVWYRSGHH